MLGTLIFGVIISGFTFLSVDAYYQEIVKGVIIVGRGRRSTSTAAKAARLSPISLSHLGEGASQYVLKKPPKGRNKGQLRNIGLRPYRSAARPNIRPTRAPNWSASTHGRQGR